MILFETLYGHETVHGRDSSQCVFTFLESRVIDNIPCDTLRMQEEAAWPNGPALPLELDELALELQFYNFLFRRIFTNLCE